MLLESEVLPAAFDGPAVSRPIDRYPETVSPAGVVVCGVASFRAEFRGWALAEVSFAADVIVVALDGCVAVPVEG